MKKLFTSVLIAILVLFVSGCSSEAKKTALVVGATAVPHAEILSLIKDDLQKEGVELEVKEFGDYTLINQALSDKQIDANFFQHIPYLEGYVSNSGNKLVSVGGVHIEPIGIYSQTLTDLAQLEDGAIVGIPNDETNEGRGLLLLQSLGLIKLADNAGLSATVTDIVENPKNLNFMELDAAMLARTLSETSISIINTNYALEAGLNPVNDALALESSESPYVNIVAVREADKDNPAIKKLISALQTQKVKDFILETYEGAVVPAF